jgi:hypothetical protein
MLIYENHVFEGKEYVSVTSDENRFVMVDGEGYSVIWMLKSEEKPCAEGELIPEAEPDAAEILDILLGVSE